MQTKTEIKKIESTPEVLIAQRLEASINQKLNFDGRWNNCFTTEAVMRLGTLTREESDFYGRFNGFDQPYFNEIDWDAVPTPFLAACCEIDHGTRALQSVFPAPSLKAVIDAANATAPDDITDFLQGVLTLDQLREKYIEATL
jgi:hypothetical protein